MDDSGTRTPNRKAVRYDATRDEFFALGGILVDDAKEQEVRELHARFLKRWGIDYPLHSVEIRNSTENFTWLRRSTEQHRRFMGDLTTLLTSIDVLGAGCVIDRPGYDHRYFEKYGRRRWHLCRTAFVIAVERAAKYARSQGAKLGVYPERCSRKDDERIRSYYTDMRAEGCPFQSETSAPYSPLTADELRETLYDIKFKYKSSPLVQIADLYLWPMAKGGYVPSHRAYRSLVDSRRLIDSHLASEQRSALGVKYSCFDLVLGRQNNKGPKPE